MAGNKEKLVIVGDGETAEIAYDYFTGDTDYEVVGFSAEGAFRRNQTLFGLPVVPFEEIEHVFDPKSHRAFIAVSYTQLNRLRSRLLNLTKQKGYSLCKYVSPEAFIGTHVQLGDNCFILENTTVQRGVRIGDNTTLWAGSIVGHHSKIGDNCFVASHAAVSGFCEVGENCFLGVNCCTASNIKIAKDCVIGAGAVVVEDTEAGHVYVGNPAKPLPDKRVDRYISGEEKI